MKLYYYACLLLFSVWLNASDSTHVQNPAELKFITRSNPNINLPSLTFSILPTDIEANTGKSFATLFKQALQMGIPWLVQTSIIKPLHGRPFVQHFDIVELIKKGDPGYYAIYHNKCDSQIFFNIIHDASNKLINAKYPNAQSRFDIIHSFYPIGNSIYNVSDTSHYTVDRKTINHISCALCIALNQNYNQIVPLLNILHATENTAETKVMKTFWQNLYDRTTQPYQKILELTKKIQTSF